MNRTADFRTERSFSERGLSGGGLLDWPRRADAWLDARGKWAWIAAMVAGFVIFVPLGLALLAWMIWGKNMFRGSFCGRSAERRDQFRSLRAMARPSGNSAFDSYRNETLRRLETEQEAFEGFLRRLREARDKQEFDRFMHERAADLTAETGAAQDPAEGAARSDAAARAGEY